jgi:zinc/manganese transport system substrate-binding protein
MRPFALACVLAATGAVAVSACGSASPADPTKGSRIVHVIAAENFWGNVVAQVGGSHVKVTSIISDPTADPHLYASDPRDAARIAQANLVVVNGLGYDDFMSKLLGAAPNSKRRVLTVAKILRPGGSDPNPHLWYDVPRVGSVARAIADTLASEDPRDAQLFKSNAARFERSLLPILDTVREIRTRFPGAPVAYTERVAGYLLDAAGLSIKTPPGFASAIEAGSEPSPRDSQALDDLVSHRRIKALLYNAQAVTPVTKRVLRTASRAGVPVVPVTETLPRSQPSYQSWQLDQARALLVALGKAP